MSSTGLSRCCHYVFCYSINSVELYSSFLVTIGAGFGGGVAAIGYGSIGVYYVFTSSCVLVSG